MPVLQGTRDRPALGIAPWFLQTISSTVNVHQGEPLSIQCVVDGDPKPTGIDTINYNMIMAFFGRPKLFCI